MDDKTILKPLVDKIETLAAQPEQEEKKVLWARHQALEKTERIPISVYYEGVPGQQWDLMFGKDHLKCVSTTGREIEFFLKKVIWMAENVPDDHIVWPIMRLNAPVRILQDWGVKLDMISSGHDLGAKAYAMPFKDKIDLSVLREPKWELDAPAWEKKKEEARELTGGRLDIYPFHDNLGFSPFDILASFCGLESAMMFAIDQPDQLKALMEFITSAMEKHHIEREKQGRINCVADRSGRYQIMTEFRVHCAFLPQGVEKPALKHEWPYFGAQTASGFGPDMYAEFVHPYHCRIAKYFTNRTVYYHGCETLDQKIVHIKDLPNLRRFHVSPWSTVARAAEVLQGRAVMEVHAHPGKVFFGWTADDMRKNVRELAGQAHGLPMDLNLSDIHSVNDNPATLGIWARAARSETEKI